MMATVFQRGNKFRAQVRIGEVKKSKSFSTKLAAIKWAEELEHDHSDGEGILLGKTVKQAFDRYAEEVSPLKAGARWEIIRLKKLARLPWAYKQIADVTTMDLQKWVNETQLSANSIRREITLVRSVFKYAHQHWRWVRRNPSTNILKPKPGKHRDRRVYDHEVEKILKAHRFDPAAKHHGLKWENCQAFLLALETGMRQGEIWRLQWENVNIDRKFLHVDKSKNGDERDIPLSPGAIEILQRFGEHTEGPVFRTKQDSASSYFRQILKGTDIKDLHFHDTRHEACTRLSKKLDIFQLARMMGHRDLKSLMIYYNETAEEIAAKLG